MLLKREISRAQEQPSKAQIDRGIEILEALIADQASVQEAGAATRRRAADAARARTLAMPVPDAVVLECVGLSKSYRRGDFALRNVTFEARYGEIIGIVGRNGNGKTTLFRLVVGELRSDAGMLRFPAIQPKTRRCAGPACAGRLRTCRGFPAWHEVPAEQPALRSGDPRRQGRGKRARGRLHHRAPGAGPRAGQAWHELSGGFKLRFALARSLVWKPSCSCSTSRWPTWISSLSRSC